MVLLFLSTVVVLCAPYSPPATSHLAAALQRVVSIGAEFYNTSYQVGVTLSDGSTASGAAGWNNRAEGSRVTTKSKYPAGSADKAFTATATMALAEAGILSLDAPVYPVIDAWHAKQTPPVPSLLALWGGDAQIHQLTARMLMQMRTGLPDYNDSALRNWTLSHPHRDFLPLDFVKDCARTCATKGWLFAPGTGGQYSGNNYVVLGLFLAASIDASGTGAVPTWAQLDQMDLLTRQTAGHAPVAFDDTMFMGTGSCASHGAEGVVHQYLELPPGQKGAGGAASGARRRGADVVCGAAGASSWHPSLALTGATVGAPLAIPSGGARACCKGSADASRASAQYWTFSASNATDPRSAGVCTFYSDTVGVEKWTNSTSARIDRLLDLGDFVDLWDYSCLNGWTMGNIAASASDVSRFYHALAHGQLVSNASLTEMLHFLPLSGGTQPRAGTPYGLGLIAMQLHYRTASDCVAEFPALCESGAAPAAAAATTRSRAAAPHSARALAPLRTAAVGARSAPFVRASTWGHPGIDWGSAMDYLAHVPALNLSFALAINTGEGATGMNTTLGVVENAGALDVVACAVSDAFLQHVLGPAFPRLCCDGPEAALFSLAC